MNKHLVFVYGTLRRGGPGAISNRFPNSKFIADAKVRGTLYDLGPFPGLILNDSNSSVVGEVHEIDEETLKLLDDFEASSQYLRKQVEISFGTERRLCWTYQPDPEFYSLRKSITSGDWVEYSNARTDRRDDT